MLHDKVEFRVDGYTRIDTIELDYDESGAGTAYVPNHANPYWDIDLITSFDDFLELAIFMLRLIGLELYEVDDYMGFMRRDLSMVYVHRH